MDKFVYTDEMKAYDEERAVAEAEGRMAPVGIDWEGYWMNQQQQMKFEEEVPEEEVRAYCPNCDWEGKCLVSKARAKELNEKGECEDIGENDFCGCVS